MNIINRSLSLDKKKQLKELSKQSHVIVVSVCDPEHRYWTWYVQTSSNFCLCSSKKEIAIHDNLIAQATSFRNGSIEFVLANEYCFLFQFCPISFGSNFLMQFIKFAQFSEYCHFSVSFARVQTSNWIFSPSKWLNRVQY